MSRARGYKEGCNGWGGGVWSQNKMTPRGPSEEYYLTQNGPVWSRYITADWPRTSSCQNRFCKNTQNGFSSIWFSGARLIALANRILILPSPGLLHFFTSIFLFLSSILLGLYFHFLSAVPMVFSYQSKWWVKRCSRRKVYDFLVTGRGSSICREWTGRICVGLANQISPPCQNGFCEKSRNGFGWNTFGAVVHGLFCACWDRLGTTLCLQTSPLFM